jgi:SWI/SNF-related matrix-associated actin-dependent regulator of chromatin subfamily B protein 1
VVTPEIFAQSLVDDYNLSSNYHHVITKSIQEQLADFHGQAFSPTDNGPSMSDNHNEMREETRGTLSGALDESEARWWAKWRRKVKREARRAVEDADALKVAGRRRKPGVNKREGTKQNGGLRKRRKTALVEVKKDDNDNDTDMLADNEMDGEDDDWSDTVKETSDEDDEWKSLSLEEIKVNEQNMHEDMRILIKVCFSTATKDFWLIFNQLDIIVASIKLDDQFEWDLDNPMASPEEFAEVYAQELGLGGEFK